MERDIWKLFLLGFSVGFLFEYIGIHTGLPSGSYEYLGFKNAMIYGVPVPMLFSWGFYLTVGYLTASTLVNNYKWLIASILVTLIDLVLDPIMVGKGLWIWFDQNQINWYGIPLSNYIGWFLTSVTVYLLYKFLFNGKDPNEVYISKILPFTYLTLYLGFFLADTTNTAPLVSGLTIAIIVILVILSLSTQGSSRLKQGEELGAKRYPLERLYKYISIKEIYVETRHLFPL